jgi:hypothetical protein
VATRRVIDPENARAGARCGPARHCAVLVDLSAASTGGLGPRGGDRARLQRISTRLGGRHVAFCLVLALGCPGLE